MRTSRKIITIIAALAMIFTSVIPAFAAEYSDLEGHWSKDYMEKLVEKGIMAGYKDGTIRPDKTVSAAEAFVMLANLYDLNDKAKEEIYDDFGAVVEKATDITWAYDQLAVCLAAGVITEDELKTIKLSEEMPKQDLAVYMVRAIQMTEDAEKLAAAKLEYNDAEDISSKCAGSVALLTEMGVVSGDTNGNFTPEASVTRAVFATMLCNVLDHLDKENIKLKLEGYLGLDTVDGFLSSITGTAIIVRDNNGIYRSYPRDAALKSTVNGSSKEITSDYEGEPIRLQLEEGKAVTAAVTEKSNVTYKQGRLNTISANTVSIKLVDLLTKHSAAYVLNNAAIKQDGKEVSFADLTKGSFLTMMIDKGTVREVDARTKTFTISGKVGTVTYDTTVTMIVKEEGKPDAVLYMDLADMPVIKRGSLNITIDRLAEGEDISVTIKGGEVSRIETKGKNATLKGQLTIITRTITDTTWTIKAEDGKSSTYSVDNAASAFSGETAIKLDTINPGDEVSVIVTSGVITEVTLEKSATPAAEKLTAEVLAVDTTNRVLTVLKDSKLVYINCKKTASILDSETGKTLSFSGLAAGDMIVAYGSYTDSTNFAATSIVIELKH